MPTRAQLTADQSLIADTDPPRAPGGSDPGMGFRPFVALMAALMAANALGVDSMLAALPQIGRALHVPSDNDRQWIIAIYVFGFGAAQLVYGPLADRHGRRPIVIVSMALYGLTSFIAGLAPSFELMLVARLLQGIAAAASRVLVVSIVRDCYSGRQMARVMSLSFIVFLLVPILAPSLGQLILFVASWHFIFFFLAVFGLALSATAALRLKETLHPEHRRAASFRDVLAAMVMVVRTRVSIGYTMGSTLVFGALLGFINSVQQVFADIFHAANLFPLVFACIAGSMGVSGFVNSRIVERFGTRQVSHGALFAFIVIAAVHSLVAATGHETLILFSVLQAAQMACFGMLGANFGSMAMEPVGAIAGTASSVQGFLSTCGGALIGIVIGQAYDGTTRPIAFGFLIVGLVALAVVFWTERGRLFHAHHPATGG